MGVSRREDSRIQHYRIGVSDVERFSTLGASRVGRVSLGGRRRFRFPKWGVCDEVYFQGGGCLRI